MRIKKYFLPCFLPVIAVLCFVFLSPAFAMQKIDERKLAQTHASRTGQLVTTRCHSKNLVGDSKNLVDDESECYTAEAFDISPAISTEGELAANGGILFSAHDDYGDNWLQNQKAVGDYYYEAPGAVSPVSVEAGRDGGYGPGTVYVRIGLGSQEVGLDSMDINVTLGSKAASSTGQDQILGTIHLDGLYVKTNGSSYVTMYKTDGELGIGTDVDVKIDSIRLATLSWGDADGCHNGDAGNTCNAGYLGLKDTIITNVTAAGSVTISVGRVDADLKSVHIKIGDGIKNMDVGISSLDTTVVLGDKKDFSGTKYVLGTLYMNDLNMNVGGYLDIYNPADNDTATTLGFGLSVPRLTLDTLAWGDSDGIGGTTTAGFVGLRSLTINNLTIAGRATVATITVQPGDISLLPVGTVFVSIGFSKLDISMDSLNTNVALGNRKSNLDQILGSVYLGGLDVEINGSVNIHTPSASTQGIVFDVDVNFTKFKLDALSWGDADGIGGNTTAGYRGLRNMAINGMSVVGSVSIGVATVNNTVVPGSADEWLFANYQTFNMSPSFVCIGLGTGNANNDPAGAGALDINISSMSWDVVVDRSRSLNSPNAAIIRSFYLSDLNARINGWVHIAAH